MREQRGRRGAELSDRLHASYTNSGAGKFLEDLKSISSYSSAFPLAAPIQAEMPQFGMIPETKQKRIGLQRALKILNPRRFVRIGWSTSSTWICSLAAGLKVTWGSHTTPRLRNPAVGVRVDNP